MTNQSLFALLQAGSGGLWSAAQDHAFIHALAAGSLDRGHFVYFLKQDYVYLIAYSRAMALAAASAPDLKLLSEFTALANETLNTEMTLHRQYCREFGISAEELEQVQPAQVCRAYSDFCLATAVTGDFVDLLAALIPCGVGYAEIGERLQTRLSEDQQHPYRQWIEIYSSAEYRRYADWMVNTMTARAAELTDGRLAELQQLFDTGCRYEWLFWEMAWTMQDWPL